jgi:hypothetical protein
MISGGVLWDHGDCFSVSLLLNRYLGTAFVSVDVWYLPNGSLHHALAGLGALFRANLKIPTLFATSLWMQVVF